VRCKQFTGIFRSVAVSVSRSAVAVGRHSAMLGIADSVMATGLAAATTRQVR